MERKKTSGRTANANRTAALRRDRRDYNLRNGLLHVLARRCDELRANPRLEFDAVGLLSTVEARERLQRFAPLPAKSWYRTAKSGETTVPKTQSGLADAARDLVLYRRMPDWLDVDQISESRLAAFERNDLEPPSPPGIRRVFEALALNETAAVEFALEDNVPDSWRDWERDYWIEEFAGLSLGRAAKLIELAAGTLGRERGVRTDQDRGESLIAYSRWLRHIADRVPLGDPDAIQGVVEAINRVGGMIAGTKSRMSVRTAEPLPERLGGGTQATSFAWQAGVVDMLVVREHFSTCNEFVSQYASSSGGYGRIVDYTLQRLAVFLLGSGMNASGTREAKVLAEALLALPETAPTARATTMDTAEHRLRTVVRHYLKEEWAEARDSALVHASSVDVPEVQEAYDWHLQAALAREASANLGDTKGRSEQAERYLSNFLNREVTGGGGDLMDWGVRDIAEDSDTLPPAIEIETTIASLVPVDVVDALSDAVWALAIARNFAAVDVQGLRGNHELRPAELAGDLSRVATQLAQVANRLQGLAAPTDYAPDHAEDFEDPARIAPLLASLEQLWRAQPTQQLADLVNSLVSSARERGASPSDLEMASELEARLDLLDGGD